MQSVDVALAQWALAAAVAAIACTEVLVHENVARHVGNIPRANKAVAEVYCLHARALPGNAQA